MSLCAHLIVIVQLTIFRLLGCIYGLFVLLGLLLRLLFNPLCLRKSHRLTPPRCMHDSRYGLHKTVKLNGRILHYVESGNDQAPLLLMIHGFPENWWSWRYQITELANEYRVVALSLPSYADSEAPRGVKNYRLKVLAEDVRALIELLGREQAIVMGHDWGGALSWEFAHRYPSMVHRLIVLSSPVSAAYSKRLVSSMQFFRSWFVFFHQVPFLPELLWSVSNMWCVQFALGSSRFGIANRELLSEEDIECYKYYFAKNGLTGPLNYYRAAMCYDTVLEAMNGRLEGKQVRIEPKTLILWGGADAFLSSAMAFDSAKFCDDAKVQVIPGASHWLQQHEPAIVTQAVRDFLKN